MSETGKSGGIEALHGRLGYQTALLGGVALVSSLLLGLAAMVTGPRIEAAMAADLKQSLTQVLPGTFDNDLLADTVTVAGVDGKSVTVYRARRAGRVEGLVFQVVGQGYAGPIVCVMGVDRDGVVQGVRVLKHAETPGLGDKIEPAKADWIHAFTGRSLGDPDPAGWAVKKDGGRFDQFAGATITPRAVVRAVKGGLELFGRERLRMLDETLEEAGS